MALTEKDWSNIQRAAQRICTILEDSELDELADMVLDEVVEQWSDIEAERKKVDADREPFSWER